MSKPFRLSASLPIAAALLLLAGGCGGGDLDAPEICSGPAWFETQLFMGRDMPGGGEVNDVLWRDFVEGVVAPRFAGGVTVLESTAYRRADDTGQIGGTPGKLLILLYRDEEAGSKAARDIAQSYAARFNQASVLRVDRPVCVTAHRGAAATQ